MTRQKAKLLAILCGVIVLLSVLLVVILALPEKEGEGPIASTGGYTELFTLDTDQVASVQIELLNQEPFTAVKQEDGTLYISDLDGYEKNATAYGDLLSTAGSFRSQRLVEENPSDLSKYGLSPAQSIMTITSTDGTQTVFKVGNLVPTQDGYYAQWGDDPNVYIVSTINIQQALVPKIGYISLALTPPMDTLDFPLVRTVDLTVDGQQAIHIAPESVNEDGTVSSYVLTDPFQSYMDSQNGSDFMYSLFGVTASQIVAVNPE